MVWSPFPLWALWWALRCLSEVLLCTHPSLEGRRLPGPCMDKSDFSATAPRATPKSSSRCACGSWSRDRNHPGLGLVQSLGCLLALRALLPWGHFQGCPLSLRTLLLFQGCPGTALQSRIKPPQKTEHYLLGASQISFLGSLCAHKSFVVAKIKKLWFFCTGQNRTGREGPKAAEPVGRIPFILGANCTRNCRNCTKNCTRNCSTNCRNSITNCSTKCTKINFTLRKCYRIFGAICSRFPRLVRAQGRGAAPGQPQSDTEYLCSQFKNIHKNSQRQRLSLLCWRERE